MTETATPPCLRLDSVVAGYGGKRVLSGVSLQIGAGEIVVLIGHNGAGKSTLLKASFGLLPLAGGAVYLFGERLGAASPGDLRRRGVAYVPQGNRVFPSLTVRENLALAKAGAAPRPADLVRASGLFPRLGERAGQRAGLLSGGEKQMLTLAGALLLSPRLLLLDEPSMGLAPPLVSAALDRVAEVRDRSGAAVLLVEQKVREALRIADRLYVLRNGAVTFEGPAQALRENEARLREVYL